MGNDKKKKRKGRPGKNPTIDEAKLKETLDQLQAPAEQLKHTIVELQVINDQLHKTNKVLTSTLKEILGEFNERLGALEMEQFGEVKGDFQKYLAKEDANVQLSEVPGDDRSEAADAEAGEAEDGGGQGAEGAEAGSEEGDPTLH
jgi:gas vesicle protein